MMITDKKTLKEYLEADKANLGIQRRYPPIWGGGSLEISDISKNV